MSTLQRIAPSTHRLSVLTDSDAHGQPLRPGQLEVMRVRRVLINEGAALQWRGDGANGSPTVVSLTGIPLSRDSTAHSATITFMPSITDMPKPLYDAAQGRISLYYPMADMPEVMGILKSRKDRLCYFWQTSDRKRTLAWLLAMP